LVTLSSVNAWEAYFGVDGNNDSYFLMYKRLSFVYNKKKRPLFICTYKQALYADKHCLSAYNLIKYMQKIKEAKAESR